MRKSMDIYTPAGSKVRYRYIAGYKEDIIKGRQHLELGEIYTIHKTFITEDHTYVFLEEVPKVVFNSVQFENANN
jgi:hypothetical protein